jgi:hypothetical protein
MQLQRKPPRCLALPALKCNAPMCNRGAGEVRHRRAAGRITRAVRDIRASCRQLNLTSQRYKVHAQRRFEENERQQQQDKQYDAEPPPPNSSARCANGCLCRHSLLLLELDKNRLFLPLFCMHCSCRSTSVSNSPCTHRLLIDRLVSDNGKLIAAIDAAHECAAHI